MRVPILSALLAIFTTLVAGYRPVQFVKHTGQSGRADQAFSLVNYHNTTNGDYDLYIRMEMYRYGSSNLGWAALGLGPGMTGALMFIMYGDPATGELTLSTRTVDGHHPPRPVAEMKDFYSGESPTVEITNTRFEPYTGSWFSKEMNSKPSHLGIAEFIVRNYPIWKASPIDFDASSPAQQMIWSSNFEQDFQGDFTVGRNIDMHKFGLGFGFIWVDYLHAQTDVPFYGPIDELKDHMGSDEVKEPKEPTSAELDAGDAILAKAVLGDVPNNDKTETPAPATPPQDDTSTPGPDGGNKVEEPVKSVKQWNIRSLMW
jgi:hypothetical protein